METFKEEISKLKFDQNVINSLDVIDGDKELLNSLLKETDSVEIEEKAKAFLVGEGEEESHSTLGFEDESKKMPYFKYIKCEVFKFLCENNSKYKDERMKVKEGLAQLIPVLAGSIALSIGLAVAVVTSVITALLIGALKVGVNAWCQQNRNICEGL